MADLKFAQPIPWAIGGGRAGLSTVPEAVAALNARLRIGTLSSQETQELHALKRMLATVERDPGELDFSVLAAAFDRFVTSWHKRNLGTK